MDPPADRDVPSGKVEAQIADMASSRPWAGDAPPMSIYVDAVSHMPRKGRELNTDVVCMCACVRRHPGNTSEKSTLMWCVRVCSHMPRKIGKYVLM